MDELETETFKNENIKPHIYCRYVDDIFIPVKSDEELIAIKNKLEKKSVLTFTFEKSIENQLPFLDVHCLPILSTNCLILLSLLLSLNGG